MQNKKTLIIVIGIVIVIGLLGYLAFSTLTSTNSQTQNGGQPITTGKSSTHISTQVPQTGNSGQSFNAPQFIPDPNRVVDSTKKLSFEEKQKLSTFLGNIAGLIQTYGYDDYNTINGLSDYFTNKGKISLQSYLAELTKSTKPGYSQYAVADSTAKIGFFYTQASSSYQATVDTNVYNTSTSKTFTNPAHVNLEFDLVKDESTWKINGVKYNVR